MNSETTNSFFSKLWIFRWSSLSFIILATPAIAVFTGGTKGFLLIFAFAIITGLLENSLIKIFKELDEGISKNKLLVFLVFWYGIGAFLNSLFRGKGLDDWRFFLINIVFLIGIAYALVFLKSHDNYRLFQIGLTIFLGIQSIFTVQALLTKPGLARSMFMEFSGAWIYGDQSDFAVYAILLPIFLWRAFQEKGLLKLILFIASLLILTSTVISSFGTPIGLLLLGGILVLGLSMFFMLQKKGLLIAIIIILVFYFGFQYTQDNEFFVGAYSRIENLLNDPRSGGYSGQENAGSRWYINLISIESFMKNPLFGSGGGNIRYSEVVGGHSSFFDSLGAYGLLGGGGALVGIVLTMFFNALFRFLRQRDWQTLFCLTSLFLLFIAGVVNPYWEAHQLLFVFLMARPFNGIISKGCEDGDKNTLYNRSMYL